MFGTERANRKACGRRIAKIDLKTLKTKWERIHNTNSHARSSHKLGIQPINETCSYSDCLMGRVALPQDAAGKLLFRFFMIAGMVTFMVTFNGLRHSGFAFLGTHHWVYPLVACVAFFLRFSFADRVTEYLIPRLVSNKLDGLTRNIAITIINLSIMAPVMATLTTLLLYGTGDLWVNIADNLPISMVVAFFANLFVVGPLVKMFYHNYLNTERGMRVLGFVERTAMPWMYLLNS